MSNPKRFNTAMIILHWLIGLMVILALIFGTFLLATTDNADPQKLDGLRAHMSIGMAVGVLMLVRVVVRFSSRKPAPAHTGNALLDKLAGLAHLALYLLVFGMVASGMGMAMMAGLPEIVFDGVGSLPASFDDLPPRAAHGLIAKLLAGLVLLHVAGALFHQFVVKDRLLGRMGIGRAPD